MMDSNFHSEPVRLNDLLDELIAVHGAMRVLRALAMRLVTRRARHYPLDHVSDHLRRDVGLPPGHPPPSFRDPRL
ncbi:hypothetical protein SAMN04488030_2174 [Aliiroseovarius halocynthiae]|uniref:DUF1127 domain-containing protein n=1 Tax=Aliiroseovarius halocynthiae TaxID=985055 RepID=A0A545SXU4_9RHOB|nr:hypothetical protein [Aliiroseovarius halocynthiae]TQV69787.1 hypothetical protein FIL88_01570 [Aliiroseovarius halocynthiae]SMR81753.1 hypothetical protein SAMN04488030_2174 [Aliiroseovarius halocynthiae]